MKWSNLEQALFSAARRIPADDRVPLAFEKRIMSRLSSGGAKDLISMWAAGLWRAAGPCLGVMMCLVVWSAVIEPPSQDHLALDLESTLLAPLDEIGEIW